MQREKVKREARERERQLVAAAQLNLLIKVWRATGRAECN